MDLVDIQARTYIRCSTAIVEKVDIRIPMNHCFGGSSKSFVSPTFYIRRCYPSYYDMILECLQNYDVVTLTGSPGIGKSVFYNYMFNRYREEHPNQYIVVASFGERRNLLLCRIFTPGSSTGVVSKSLPIIDKSLHLYDGSPECVPQGEDNQMVCFSSPNFSWLGEMRKEANHMRLFMPPWELDELLVARSELALPLADEVIEARFSLFGGSARHCLQLKEIVYKLEEAELIRKASSIQSLDFVQRILSDRTNMAEISQSVFHFIPHSTLPCFYTYTFCSVEVRQIVEQSIRHHDSERQREVCRWLKVNSEGTSLLGWMFEYHVAWLFKNGVEFALRPLSADIQQKRLSMPMNCYLKSPTNKHEAVDGHYYAKEDGILFLFRMTIADSHPVNAKGIIEYIKEIGNLHEPILAKRIQVVFVFVTPSDSKLSKQSIRMFQHGLDSSVALIPYMRDANLIELESMSIQTVSELSNALELPGNTSLFKYRKRVEQFVQLNGDSAIWAFLEHIEQYRYDISDFYESGDSAAT